jgi:hypothetical protein
MANDSKNIRSGNLKKAVVEETAPPDKISKVNIQSLIDGHIYYTGRASGELYEWSVAGAIVAVDERDVPDLLTRRLGKKMCCGSGTNLIFQLANT